MPGALIFDAGALSVATTGIKSAAYTTQIPAGLYWMAVICNDANPTLPEWYRYLWPLGMSPNGSTPTGRLYKDLAYGALPDPAPTDLTAGGSLFWLGFRIASVP